MEWGSEKLCSPNQVESRLLASKSPTCWLLGDELDCLGLGPEMLAGAVDPDVHALRDVIGLLQGKVPEEEEV